MIHSYYKHEPKKGDIPKGHKVTKCKIDGKIIIYFVIESGNKPTKDLTAYLINHYKTNEKKKQDAIEYQYWYRRMCESQKNVFC